MRHGLLHKVVLSGKCPETDIGFATAMPVSHLPQVVRIHVELVGAGPGIGLHALIRSLTRDFFCCFLAIKKTEIC